MARIRSIHPGIFTDDAFMSASMSARLLLIGIWCEAWDDGVFEWKPITLKAKVFAADNVDIASLLVELQELNFIKQFGIGSKQFGTIRNFCKWQRPKKPNSSGLLPVELRAFVALGEAIPPPVPHQFPTSSENSPQMEDGGWRMEDGIGKKEAAAAFFDPGFEKECQDAAGFGELSGFCKISELAGEGFDPQGRIIPIIRDVAAGFRRKGETPENWLYFVPAIRDPGRKVKPANPVSVTLGGFYAAAGSRQHEAWKDHLRATTRNSGKTDARGGWRFPTEWPPGFVATDPKQAGAA